jgi:transcriptional regulator with XRE-family HTH domain
MQADTRKPIEPWQREDAARLKALFRSRSKLGQMQFGLTHDIGTQSAVAQYLNGVRPLNVAVALKFANGLGVPVSAFSPTLAEQITGVDPMDPISEVVAALPEDDRRMVLDFIQYRWERAGQLVSSARTSRYIEMIESIKADMQRRQVSGED